jgi:CDGSH-type Zn-finger protein
MSPGLPGAPTLVLGPSNGYTAAVPDDDVVITSYRDGPLLVRGPFRLQDQDGNEIEVGRKTVALCRCGKSRIRPFCDGTHALVRFRAPSEVERGREAGAAARPEPARFAREG